MASITQSGPISYAQYSGNANIDALMSYSYYGTGIWANNTVSYSFPNENASWDASNYDGKWTTAANGFMSFNSVRQTNVEEILQVWNDVADINFYKITESATEVGDIRFSYANIGYMAAYSNNVMERPIAGDIFLNNNQYNADYTAGQMMFFVIMHELGHALGFKHPMPDSSLAEMGLDKSLPTELDSNQYTIMSYTLPDTYSGVYPSTPMLFDIQAIQHMYGANNTTRTGDDVYAISSTTQVVMTIWDAGGEDTISTSDATQSVIIDLREGHFSSIGSNISNNIGIAYNTIVENVIAGQGNDIIHPNSASNNINGMSGIDTVIYSTRESLTANSNGSWTVGSDTLVNVERVELGGDKIAIDMSGDQSGGKVAKFINAAFGSDSLSNKMYVGAGLGYFDSAMSVLELAQTCEYAGLLGSSNQTFVQNVWENVMGSEIDNTNLEHFVGLLDNQTYTKASLLALAIDLELNDNNPVLIGVQQTGLEYI